MCYSCDRKEGCESQRQTVIVFYDSSADILEKKTQDCCFVSTLTGCCWKLSYAAEHQLPVEEDSHIRRQSLKPHPRHELTPQFPQKGTFFLFSVSISSKGYQSILKSHFLLSLFFSSCDNQRCTAIYRSLCELKEKWLNGQWCDDVASAVSKIIWTLHPVYNCSANLAR